MQKGPPCPGGPSYPMGPAETGYLIQSPSRHSGYIDISSRPRRNIIFAESPPRELIHCRTCCGYMSHSACVPTELGTGLPFGPGIQAAWNPSVARRVTQILLRGTMPSTSVQADRQAPSITTLSPEFRTAE